MQSIQNFFFLFAFVIILSSCGSSELGKVQEVENSGDKPDWIDQGQIIGRFENQKVIFFTGMGESSHRDTAKEAAQLNGAGQAAVAISAIAQRQFKGIVKGKPSQDSGMTVLTTGPVNVSGMRISSIWWKHDRILKNNKTNPPLYEDLYTYYVRFAMDYDSYVQRRNQKLKEYNLSKDENEIALKKLKALDQQ